MRVIKRFALVTLILALLAPAGAIWPAGVERVEASRPDGTTRTEVSCAPGSALNPVPAGGDTTCTATVRHRSDSHVRNTPKGTVVFTSSLGSDRSCGLNTKDDKTSFCSVTYTNVPAGSSPRSVTATYEPTSSTLSGVPHQGSQGSTSVFTAPAAKISTQTSVSCGPLSGPPAASTCTATVSNTAAGGPPTGQVHFTRGPLAGTFNQPWCDLPQEPAQGATSGSCSVKFTPGEPGTHTIFANYSGDASHATSSGSTTLTAK